MIVPGKTIGVLGGGAEGRLLVQAAQALGYRVHVFSTKQGSIAGEIAQREFSGGYSSVEALKEFVGSCDVVTIATENFPVEPWWDVEKNAHLVPSWQTVEVCQHRVREKLWLKKSGFPHVPFVEVEASDEIEYGARRIGLPCVIKSAEFGFEGRGQLKVADEESLRRANEAYAKKRAVVEKYIDFKCELSVTLARGFEGEMQVFPPAENIHSKYVLDLSLSPARISTAIAAEAQYLARNIAERLGLVGLLTVELFLTDRGELLVNELAPRPHGAANGTLDGAMTSQYEQQIRAVCGLPLGSAELRCPSTTVTILGDAWSWRNGSVAGEPDWAAVLGAPDAKLHLYGKGQPSIGRKMGFFTVTGKTLEQTMARATELKQRLARRHEQ